MIDVQPLTKSRLVVQTSLQALTEVWCWFEQFNRPPVSDDAWVQCQLALTEGFTNVVRYAHQHLPQTTLIDIEIKLFINCVEMRILYSGQQLAPVTQLHRSLYAGSKDDKLAFLSPLIDKLYCLQQPDQQNCLVMLKKI